MAIAMMQKDEGDLLRTWVTYHAALVGGANLCVIDNGSTDSRTLEALAFARSLGARVESHPAPEDFERKGTILSRLFDDMAADYDWFFPLDCDEFLITLDGEHPSTDVIAFRAALGVAEDSRRPLIRISRALKNWPGSTLCRPGEVSRAGIRSGYRVDMEVGLHYHALTRKRYDLNAFVDTPLAVIDFHRKPLRRMLAGARLKLRQRVPDFALETLKAFHGRGFHLTSIFRVHERYRARYAKPPRGGIDVEPLFAEKGLAVPFSEPEPPLSVDERRTLLDPVNVYHEAQRIGAPVAEAELIYGFLRNAASCLQFGISGTTHLARAAGVEHIVTIETRSERIAAAIRQLDLQELIDAGRLRIRHILLDDPRSTVDPRRPPPAERLASLYDQARATGTHDVVSIDGPYRMGCAAAVYVCQHDPVVLLHDCVLEHFQDLRAIYEPVGSVNALFAFRKRPGMATEARKLLKAYGLSPW